MLSTLSLSNFKGATRSLTFTPRNFVTGRNFSGKTAVDQAIRAVILGYVPGLKPETTASLKQFASDYPMNIEATVAGLPLGIRFERIKSSVKQTNDATLADKIDEPTRVLFDPGLFFGLSDAARISKACELVQSTGGSADELFAIVAALVGDSEWAKRTVTNWKAVVSEAKTFNDVLSLSQEFWKTQKSEKTAERTRMQKMAEGLTDMNIVESELAKLPQRGEAIAYKVAIQAEIQALSEQIAAANAVARTAELTRNRIAQIAPLAESLKDAEANTAEVAAHQEALEKEFFKNDGCLFAARAAHSSALARYRAAEEHAARYSRTSELANCLKARRDKLAIAKSAHAACIVESDKIREELSAAIAARDAVRRQGEATDTAQEDQPALSGWDEAPGGDYIATCILRKSYLSPVDIIEVRSFKPCAPVRTAEEIEEERSRSFEQAEALADAEDAVSQLQEKLMESEDATERANRVVQVAAAEVGHAETAAHMLAELNGFDAAAVPTKEQIAELQKSVDHYAAISGNLARELPIARAALGKAHSHEQSCRAASDEIIRLNASVESKPVAPEQVSEWEQARTSKKAALATVEAQIEAITRLEQDRKRVTDAAKQREEVSAQLKLADKAADVIAQKKQEVVSLSIEAPLAIANKLADGILKGHFAFEQGCVGVRRGDQFIAQGTLSGTESALLFMGLTAGLAHRSKLRILMLDEVAKIGPENIGKFMRNLCEMISDRLIDQFFVFGPPYSEIAAAVADCPEIQTISLE